MPLCQADKGDCICVLNGVGMRKRATCRTHKAKIGFVSPAHIVIAVVGVGIYALAYLIWWAVTVGEVNLQLLLGFSEQEDLCYHKIF